MRVLLLLGILLAWKEAQADCGIPQWMGTADGTAVPFTGSLYIYDESLGFGGRTTVAAEEQPWVEVAWDGKPGETSFTRIGEAVARLDYTGFPGTTMKVHLKQWDDTFSYHLEAQWRASTKQPRVLQTWHHTSAWTCSWADSLMIQLDQRAAAVRARWTYGGKTTEWVVPPRTERSKVVVELGKINCGSTTLAPQQLAAGGKLELFAIRFDGSEVPITGLPTRISTKYVRDDERGLDAALTLVSLDEPKLAAAAPRKVSKWIGVAALLLLGCGLILGFRLAGKSGNGCSQALR